MFWKFPLISTIEKWVSTYVFVFLKWKIKALLNLYIFWSHKHNEICNWSWSKALERFSSLTYRREGGSKSYSKKTDERMKKKTGYLSELSSSALQSVSASPWALLSHALSFPSLSLHALASSFHSPAGPWEGCRLHVSDHFLCIF